MKKFLLSAICAMFFVLSSCNTNTPSLSNKVVTGNATDINHSSVILHGKVNVDISIYNGVGFGMMISDNKEDINAHKGQMFSTKKLIGKDFKLELTNLSSATEYYYCAWLLLNGIQYEFGSVKSFNTTSSSLPTVLTLSLENITTNSVSVRAETIYDEGASNITERGVVYSTKKTPTIADYKIVSDKGIGKYSVTIENLNSETSYYVCAYAINDAGINYGQILRFSTEPRMYLNGHEYVDLGLSVKWATMNIGATSPEEIGNQYAWGEVHTKGKDYWGYWDEYKWASNNSGSDMKKYNYTDNKTVLDKSDDAAAYNWGGNWRMPTDKELTELRENCSWTWTTLNSIYGYKITSKMIGYTHRSIFLPVTSSNHGDYWSSTLQGYEFLAWTIEFDASKVSRDWNERRFTLAIRPVCP